jgi:cell division GTPase FtsZ
VDVASSLIAAEAAPDANVIWGVNFDNELEDEMRITIIATGFDNQKSFAKPAAAPVAAPAAPVAPVEAPKAAPKAEAPKREKPKSSADEELDRLMKEFGTPKKKKINR